MNDQILLLAFPRNNLVLFQPTHSKVSCLLVVHHMLVYAASRFVLFPMKVPPMKLRLSRRFSHVIYTNTRLFIE